MHWGSKTGARRYCCVQVLANTYILERGARRGKCMYMYVMVEERAV
jgi:hypothetical protein